MAAAGNKKTTDQTQPPTLVVERITTNAMEKNNFTLAPFPALVEINKRNYRARGFCRFVRLQSTHFRY
jgi:hypothetical protein